MDFDVVSLPEADHVEAGEHAPNFTRPLVNDEYWEDTSLTDLLDESPVVLVFHSMDGAFPATYAWQELSERELEQHGVQVVGLSISSPYEHKRTIEERGIEQYALFSDPANDVARKYGIEHDLDGMTGVEEPRPAVYVIDQDGTVTYAWVAEEWPDFPDYDEIEAAVDDL
ncbi:redoxin domain-containing protein [Salarchaeum sp. JOR-1]|uniref:peroxiredoxin family protein n=1 Tax=Salarchaeum sp. JOR-1 TaxID=2599399 RepID=UPI00198149B6|nr:redoxin domain-containing protein [Salarchaeum sp. JOR-1]